MDDAFLVPRNLADLCGTHACLAGKQDPATWRISAGANYRYSDQWIFRGGLAYDQSPVRDAERTPRLPDQDRVWAAVGVQYRYSPSIAVDLAWAYIWVRDPNINQNEGSTAANGLISGSYRNNVNIVGLQLTYTAK